MSSERAPRRNSRAAFQYGMFDVVVVDDEVGRFGRVRGSEVQLLTGDVAPAVAALDLFAGAEQRNVSLQRTTQRLVELDCDEDAEVPVFEQLWSEQKDTIEEQNRMIGCDRMRTQTRCVSLKVERGRAIPTAAVRSEGSSKLSRSESKSNESL